MMLHTIKRTYKQYREGRSQQWPAIRKEWLKSNPTCAACGDNKYLEVHHIVPFSWPGGRERELDMANLLTLCEHPAKNCHLRFGHLGDYRSVNVDVITDSSAWLSKYKTRPYRPSEQSNASQTTT